MDTQDICFIDSEQALVELCKEIESTHWIVLDTEFMRENTYYPQLCLLQIATQDKLACIDPLALTHLDPILDIIYNPNIIKIMHACSQDMEIFYHLRGSLPSPVFDTQVAAPLLGFPPQVGYARLIEDLLGIKLDKTHTRTDWSRRPLSQEQLRYAADDVLYLSQAYPLLHEQLNERSRLEWLQEDFAALSDAGPYSKPPHDAWLRIKGSNRLSGKQLSVLQALAEWREQTARETNRPRSWLMRDDILLDMARQRPTSTEALSHIRGLNERTLRKYRDTLLEIIKHAMTQTAEKVHQPPRPTPLTTDQESLVDILMAVVRQRASEQSISPSVLASRKDLENLVRGEGQPSITQGWKAAMVGNELKQMLDGKTILRVQNGKLEIETV